MKRFIEFLTHKDNDYSDQELVSLYMHAPEKTIKELASITGKSIGDIYRILHSYDVIPNRLKTNHKNVVEFYNNGMSIPQIAELTGYTTRNVRYILSKLKNG